MGLDFRTAEIPYDEDLPPEQRAHWSYSGFHRFRQRLAAEIGIELEEMQGFGGDKEWDEKQPLTPLLTHSDCEALPWVNQDRFHWNGLYPLKPEARCIYDKILRAS